MKYSIYNELLSVKNIILWLIFLIWPFFSFVFALLTYRNKTSKLIVFSFLVLYGLTFVLSFSGADAYVYHQRLLANAKRPFSEFWNMVGGIYADDTSVDFVEPFISFLVSRITSKHFLLFGAYAFVFGFFYLRSINLLIEKAVNKLNTNEFLHLFFFIMINPIFNINGFRFWTATWVFFWGAYHVILLKDKRYLIPALFSSFVHFSFIIAFAVLLLYSLAGNRNTIYFTVLILSFILPGLITPYLNNILPGLGQGLQDRYTSYTNENYILNIEEHRSTLKWFVTNNFSLYYLFFAILFLKYRSKDSGNDNELNNLFSFLLLFLSFTNFFSGIPTMQRFQVVFLIFGALYVFLVLLHLHSKKMYFLTLISLFPILLQAALGFRLGSESINVFLLFPIPGFILNQEIALSRFLF